MRQYDKQRTANRRLAKKRFQGLNEALCPPKADFVVGNPP